MLPTALVKILDRLRPARRPAPPDRLTALLATPAGRPAGWWRDDPTEQLRHFTSWVYAAVNAIAQEVARSRPQLCRCVGPSELDLEPLPETHPLARLLACPNPWLTPWELWYLTTLYLELTGNCYWHVAPRRGTAEPGELWVVPSPWVRVLPDPAAFVAGYEVTPPGGSPTVFAADEIVHLKYPNPLDPYTGLSPLQANALTVDANVELQRSRFQTFQVGQRPGIVLRTDQTLTEPTVRRLEEKLQSRFAGRENWHRPLVLEQGLSASPWTLTPAEMDYLNSSRLTRDEIFAVYRVPAPVAGIVEHVGLGSDIWHGARVMFREVTIQPKLELIGQALTRDLGRRYGPGVVVRFPETTPRNPADRRADDQLDAKLGLRTYNEIRRARGLEPYADPRFDEPLLPGEGRRVVAG